MIPCPSYCQTVSNLQCTACYSVSTSLVFTLKFSTCLLLIDSSSFTPCYCICQISYNYVRRDSVNLIQQRWSIAFDLQNWLSWRNRKKKRQILLRTMACFKLLWPVRLKFLCTTGNISVCQPTKGLAPQALLLILKKPAKIKISQITEKPSLC